MDCIQINAIEHINPDLLLAKCFVGQVKKKGL